LKVLSAPSQNSKTVNAPFICVTRETVEYRGAEAVVHICGEEVRKHRVPKGYRVRWLDERLRTERARAEARLLSSARRAGVPTPIVLDLEGDVLTLQRINGPQLKDCITPELSGIAGELVGRLHSVNIVHGDLTTSNMLWTESRLVLIDFGLAYTSLQIEDQATDLHVFFQTLRSTHQDDAGLRRSFEDGYCRTYPRASEVLEREREVQQRGRYKHMGQG